MSNSTPQRLLIRATNWIGDTIMTFPAVARLRQALPDAYIAILYPEKLHDLWRHTPDANELLPFTTLPDIAAIRAHQFDTALLFPNSFRSAWEAWRAGIPRRIGYRGHWRSSLLTEIVPEPPGESYRYESITVDKTSFKRKVFNTQRHQVHRHLDLAARLGANPEPIPPKLHLGTDESALRRKFLGFDPRPVLGLNPTAEYGPAKRWPAERFAEIARRLYAATSCRILLIGGPRDTELIDKVADLIGLPDTIIKIAGKTTLMELCVLLKSCRLLITNDTGPMHLAAALDIPQIVLFGSTSPELTGPLGRNATVLRHHVECNPCFLRECPIDFRCMKSLTIEEVTVAALQHFQAA